MQPPLQRPRARIAGFARGGGDGSCRDGCTGVEPGTARERRARSLQSDGCGATRVRARDSIHAGLSWRRAALRPSRLEQRGHDSPCRKRRPDPVLTDSNPTDSEALPSINEINVANQPALANLHLDVHVYATQPSERFVYINMRKYREGATLAGGPVLERIRRDGVVLNFQGFALCYRASNSSLIVYDGRMRKIFVLS